MAQATEQAFRTPRPPSLPGRFFRNLGHRLRRRVFLPGDSLADAAKRASAFVIGWGALIGLLAWGAYRQGFLHGVGDGFTFCAALFLLAVLVAPDYSRPGGPRGRNDY
jgi:hypothetical protein